LLAASFHYFRHRPGAFAPALQALRNLGADSVESPVPWAAHEDGPGRFAFDRDAAHLPAFLTEAARVGLAVHLRLGPAVGSDLTGLGLPPAVSADRSTAARHPDGTPHVVPLPPRWLLAPSYASRTYRARARAWIAAVAEAVRPFLIPTGPVQTLMLGDLWPFLGRNPAAAPDCHEDALAAWNTARAAATPVERDRLWPGEPAPSGSFPGSPEFAGIGLVRFAERTYLDFLAALVAAARDVVGDATTVAATTPPAGLFAPVGAGLLANAFDRVGLDAYGDRRHPLPLDRDARLLAGTVRRPFASFLPVGTPPYLPHLDVDDQLHALLACLAAGLGGVMLSMGLGRDRWCGGLLDEALHDHDATYRYRRLLHGVGRSNWLAGRCRPVAALLVPRDYVRGALAATAELIGAPAPGLAAAFDFPPPAALDPADRTPTGGAWWRWFEEAEYALHALGAPYVLVDDEGPLAPDVPLLLAPTLAACPKATLDRLRARIGRGAAVLCGPATPEHELASGAAVDVTGFPAPLPSVDLDAVANALEDRHVRPPVERLERLSLFDATGELSGLALVNRSRRDIPLGVALEGWSPSGALPVSSRTPTSEPRPRRDTAAVPPSTPPVLHDLDEPGAAPAAGTVAPGAIRLLVPAPRRRDQP
jgi:hypothetical protein